MSINLPLILFFWGDLLRNGRLHAGRSTETRPRCRTRHETGLLSRASSSNRLSLTRLFSRPNHECLCHDKTKQWLQFSLVFTYFACKTSSRRVTTVAVFSISEDLNPKAPCLHCTHRPVSLSFLSLSLSLSLLRFSSSPATLLLFSFCLNIICCVCSAIHEYEPFCGWWVLSHCMIAHARTHTEGDG